MQCSRSANKAGLVLLVAVAVSLVLQTSYQTVYATDCNTNCDKACTTNFGYVDFLCRQRCLAEKKLDCTTDIQSCDFWSTNLNPGTKANFRAAVAAIEEANRQSLVEDVHACHQVVDGGATAAGVLGAAYKLAYDSANLTKINPWAYAAQELAKHFLHCACNSAAYRPVPKHDAVYLQNQCNRRIQTAISYKAIDGQWATNGWWILDPGEKAFVAKTANTIFYTYAESIDPTTPRLYWSGSDYYAPIRGSSQRYGFQKQQITMKEWGTWTTSFTCR
jgi:hypothetical protein